MSHPRPRSRLPPFLPSFLARGSFDAQQPWTRGFFAIRSGWVHASEKRNWGERERNTKGDDDSCNEGGGFEYSGFIRSTLCKNLSIGKNLIYLFILLNFSFYLFILFNLFIYRERARRLFLSPLLWLDLLELWLRKNYIAIWWFRVFWERFEMEMRL